MSPDFAISSVKELTVLPDLVTTSTGMECFSMLMNIVSTSPAMVNVVGSYEVTSNLSQMFPSDP